MLPALATVDGSQLAAARRAVSVATVDDAITELRAEWEALEIRRTLRARRRIGERVQQACSACHKFVVSAYRECPHCGFWGARGYAK